jgi:hypothetical protein
MIRNPVCSENSRFPISETGYPHAMNTIVKDTIDRCRSAGLRRTKA